MIQLHAPPPIKPDVLDALPPGRMSASRAPKPAESFEQTLARQEKPVQSAERDKPAPAEVSSDSVSAEDHDAPAAETTEAADTTPTREQDAAPDQDDDAPVEADVDADIDVETITAEVIVAASPEVPVPADIRPEVSGETKPAVTAEPVVSLAAQTTAKPASVAQEAASPGAPGVPTTGAHQPALPTAQRETGDQPQSPSQQSPAPPLPPVAAPVAAEAPASPEKSQPRSSAPLVLTATPIAVADTLTTLMPQPTDSTGTATTTTTPAQPSEHAARAEHDALNAARLARGLQSAVNQRGGAVTLRLTPPELGTVRVQMQVQASRVSVQFHAETPQAASLLAQQLGQLRTTLEGQGLQVDRIAVQTMQPMHAGNSAHTSSQHQQQDTPSQQQDARSDDGRSRGSFDRRHDQPRQERREAEEAGFDFRRLFEQGKER